MLPIEILHDDDIGITTAVGTLRIVVEADSHGLGILVHRHGSIGCRLRRVGEVAGIGGAAVDAGTADADSVLII